MSRGPGSGSNLLTSVTFIIKTKLMKLHYFWKYSVLIILTAMSGCATTPVATYFPAEKFSTHALPETEAKSPMAVHPDKMKYAFCNEGLFLYSFNSDKTQNIYKSSPSRLAWSQDGTFLVAAINEKNKSRLLIISEQGSLAETEIAGQTAQIVHSDDQIVIGAVASREFSFGMELSYLLHRWDKKSPHSTEVLGTSIIHTQTGLSLNNDYTSTMQLALSPENNALVYTKLVDPPLLKPSLEITHRNLTSKVDTTIARRSIFAQGLLVVNSGKDVIFGDGLSATYQASVDLSFKKILLHQPGLSLSASHEMQFIALDGTLYQDTNKIISFTPDTEFFFGSDGIFCLIRQGTKPFLLKGLL